MIDIVKAKNFFNNYIQQYDINNGKIALKVNHIKRVTDISKKTAEFLKLSQEDKELAELIGLLHDIGRFEQVKIYNTFIDKDSVNHGELGVKILFEDGLIKEFIEDRKYDEIIKRAILNHNRPKIENCLNEKEVIHSKIIRDADKTDIMYTLTYENVKDTYCCEDMSNEKITDEILREFIEDKAINYKKITTHADIFVAHMAYVFDFNYIYGLKIIKENDYLKTLLEKVNFNNEETIKKSELIYSVANKYVKNTIERGEINGK